MAGSGRIRAGSDRFRPDPTGSSRIQVRVFSSPTHFRNQVRFFVSDIFSESRLLGKISGSSPFPTGSGRIRPVPAGSGPDPAGSSGGGGSAAAAASSKSVFSSRTHFRNRGLGIWALPGWSRILLKLRPTPWWMDTSFGTATNYNVKQGNEKNQSHLETAPKASSRAAP